WARVAMKNVKVSPIGRAVTIYMADLAHATLAPAMPTGLIRIAGRSAMLGATLHHPASNVADAVGSLQAGPVIAAGVSPAAPPLIGTVVATVGFAMLLAVLALLRIRARRRLTQLREAQILHTEREHVAVCG